jgi:hypothetical protein
MGAINPYLNDKNQACIKNDKNKLASIILKWRFSKMTKTKLALKNWTRN